MEIKQLRSLVMVADTKSFKAAGRNLYISSSQVSKLIKALEEELGYCVLIRKKDGVVLTEEGIKIYRSAIKILNEVEIIGVKKAEEKSLSVGVIASANLNMAPIFSEYVSQGATDNYLYKFFEKDVFSSEQELHVRKFDMAFTCIEESDITPFEMKLLDTTLSFYPIKKVTARAYMRKGHMLSQLTVLDVVHCDKLRIVQINGGIFAPMANPGYIHDRKVIFDYLQVDLVTNSLDLVKDVLKSTDLVYIGIDIFQNIDFGDDICSVPLSRSNSSVIFGYAKRNNLELSTQSSDYLRFIKGKLK